MRKTAAWCRHFTGIQNKVCKAGIDYESVKDASTRPYRWPCTLKGGACEKQELFTEAEIEADEAEFRTRLDSTLKAREAIVATKEKRGIIPCTACEKGQLGFSIASNGHIHAVCSTAGCLRWME